MYLVRRVSGVIGLNVLNVLSTVPYSIGLDEVNNIIDRKMESLVAKSLDTSESDRLVKAQIEPLDDRLTELEDKRH